MTIQRNHLHNGSNVVGTDPVAYNGGQDATKQLNVGKVLLCCLKIAGNDRRQWKAYGWTGRRKDTTGNFHFPLRRLAVAVCCEKYLPPTLPMVMAYSRALANELVRYEHLGIVEVRGELWKDGKQQAEPNLDCEVFLTFIGR